jgi:class 3 adenylate cyclase
MARFATDCLAKFGQVVNQLEESLGPDTRDLGMRIGMHSGPVTAGTLSFFAFFDSFSLFNASDVANKLRPCSPPKRKGVLKGDRARFQLFGDVSI